MKPKFRHLLPAFFILLVSNTTQVRAAPLVSIGDNTDVYFNGYSSLQWASNIFRDEDDEVDDLIWTVAPGFEVNVGRGATNADLSLVTRYIIRRYDDNDRLDTELFNIRLQGAYRTSRLDLGGSAYFREEKSSTGDSNFLDDLIETDNMGGEINAEYRFSPKFSFGTGLRYSEREYKDPYDIYFADRETYTIPFDLFYELTPKVDLSLGYQYTETDVNAITGRPAIVPTAPGSLVPTTGTLDTSAYDQESHFFNVGLRGNLLPKLTGFFKIGYRIRENDDRTITNNPDLFPSYTANTIEGRDNGMLGLDADLTWAATPKLTARLGLSRDFGVGGEGQSTENTSVDINANYSLNSYFGASAFARYTLREYDGPGNREDNQYEAGARLTYSPNEHWSFSGGYTYNENDSDAVNRSYIDHTFDVTASLRY